MTVSKPKSVRVSKKSAPKSETTHVTPPAEIVSASVPLPSAAVVSTGAPAPAVTPPPGSLSLAARVANAVTALQAVQEQLALETVPLSVTTIKRSAKFRKGGEAHVPTLASLSGSYGLEVPTRPTAAMTASLQQATDLEPLRVQIGTLSKSVDDTYFGSRSDAWTTATTLYSMLKKAGKREPTLLSALVPVSEFFAYRHPLVAANHPKRPKAKAALKAQKAQAAQAAALAAAGGKTGSGASSGTASASNSAPAPQGGPAGGPANGAAQS
jgi:hypothetical protein